MLVETDVRHRALVLLQVGFVVQKLLKAELVG